MERGSTNYQYRKVLNRENADAIKVGTTVVYIVHVVFARFSPKYTAVSETRLTRIRFPYRNYCSFPRFMV